MFVVTAVMMFLGATVTVMFTETAVVFARGRGLGTRRGVCGSHRNVRGGQRGVCGICHLLCSFTNAQRSRGVRVVVVVHAIQIFYVETFTWDSLLYVSDHRLRL